MTYVVNSIARCAVRSHAQVSAREMRAQPRYTLLYVGVAEVLKYVEVFIQNEINIASQSNRNASFIKKKTLVINNNLNGLYIFYTFVKYMANIMKVISGTSLE